MTPALRVVFVVLAIAGVALGLYTVGNSDGTARRANEAPVTRSKAAGVEGRAQDSPAVIAEHDRERLRRRAGDDPDGVDGPGGETPAAVIDPERQDETDSPEPPEPVQGPSLSPATEDARARVQEAVTDVIAEARGAMQRKCRDELDGGGIGDEGIELGFSLSFDAEGRVLASSVQQDGRTTIEGLDRCLAPFAHEIEVPAPGESVSVDVTFRLP